jgi:hypothetical protein
VRLIALAEGQLSWNALLDRQFSIALEAANKAALLVDRNSLTGLDFVRLNLAHALLFSGKTEEAIAKYSLLPVADISSDFAVMLKAGICHPYMRTYDHTASCG